MFQEAQTSGRLAVSIYDACPLSSVVAPSGSKGANQPVKATAYLAGNCAWRVMVHFGKQEDCR